MKKLITLLMVLLLIAGCSGKKDTQSKPESSYAPTIKPEETDPYEKYYGTWTTSSVSVDGTKFTKEQLDALGDGKEADIILVFNKDGTMTGYDFYSENIQYFNYSKNEDNSSIVLDGVEFLIEDNELVCPINSNTTLYMEKISDRQDSSIIEELIAAKPKQEEIIEEETISKDTIRPEIKEAIDTYESFIDEYLEFMDKYEKSNGTDLSLLVDYANFLSSLSDYEEKMDALQDDLTDAEYWYYYEVLTRCNEKLIKASR